MKTPNEINQLLLAKRPATVRRVLPKPLIERHLKMQLRQLLGMMHAFQAILTFPTAGRNLPMAALKKIQTQLTDDLQHAEGKLMQEVDFLMNYVQREFVLQTSVMMNVVAETASPFCVLNEVNYMPKDNRLVDNRVFIPSYVTLWAQQRGEEEPVQVWLQLEPKDPVHRKWMQKEPSRSAMQALHPLENEVYFHEFDTVVSLNLYDEPNELEAIYSGKNYEDLLREFELLRKTLIRQKGNRGEFIHVVWCKLEKEKHQFIV